ncbi:hypothetical protein A3D03_00090 [Candidatus Gottesmanbacteria bacterium RIFCSPHIGHO2_02_FULL_40_13]|uniref:Glycosyltransferase RgtA/B/C/D-like domain-containing protein n=1 Tax=Candidatus Gottesmanbacteria bacterium RIFCSPHIGHO2_02_FULL_40_13 TaxID=1798384 RepID=A0A1F6A806_9BACT|nr:MAG: hypothetical protein A3D03_00090 [Candidatus Gottesmanbacteria bacterium RIFCSPHIGHO2_02_FULL_40_13]
MKIVSITIGLIIFSCVIYLIDLTAYGATWDELVFHMETGKRYVTFLKTKDLKPILQYENSSWFPPVAPTLGYLFVDNKLIAKYFPIESDRFHLAGILFGSLGVGTTFLITFILTKRISVSLFSALLLATNTQFVTQLHNNIRDTGLMFFFSFSILLLLLWLISKHKLFLSFACGIVAGLTTDTKQNGGLLIFITLVWFLIHLKKTGWRNFTVFSFVYLFSFVAAFLIFWPYLWSDTYIHLLSVWNFLTNPSIIAGPALFYDKVYISLKNIPFYYPWVMLSILHTPPVIFMAIVGLFISVKGLFTKQKTALILLWLFIPLSRFMIPKSAIAFDQIRHIFEVIPSIAVFTGIALSFFLDKYSYKKNFKKGIVLITFFVLFYNFLILLRYRPYGTSYFNFLAGPSSYVNHAFDVEYFGNVYREAANYLNTAYTPDTKYYTAGLGAHILENGGLKNYKTDNMEDDFDYVIFMNKQTVIRNNSYVLWLVNNKKPIYTIKREGKILFYQYLPYKKEYYQTAQQ